MSKLKRFMTESRTPPCPPGFEAPLVWASGLRNSGLRTELEVALLRVTGRGCSVTGGIVDHPPLGFVAEGFDRSSVVPF